MCGKEIQYRRNLHDPIRGQHGGRSPKARWPCPTCKNRTFGSQASLRDHKSKRHRGYDAIRVNGATLRARPIENIPAGTIGDDKAGVFPGSPPLDGSQGLRRVPEKGSPACPGSTGASRAAMLSMPPKTLRVPLWPLQ